MILVPVTPGCDRRHDHINHRQDIAKSGRAGTFVRKGQDAQAGPGFTGTFSITIISDRDH